MAFLDPILIPRSREDEWSKQIGEILNQQLDTDQEIPSVSIFLVPEMIKKQKPEAYEPQQIGLGPNYHFKPWPYRKMEQRKLTAVRRILQYCKITDFEEEVLLKVCDRVRDIRGCYDIFLQDDDYFLARILTIDGLFLLFLFHSYNSGVDSGDERYVLQQKSKESNEHIVNVEVDTRRRLFAQDLMMAENQIPFTVLKEIDMALNSPSGNSIVSDDNFSGIIFRSFCVTHSPLELCSLAQAPSHVEHLLDYMYHSIVNNVPLNNNGPQDLETSVHGPRHQVRSMKSKKEEELLLPTGNTGTGPSLGKFPSPIFHFVQKIPWEKFIPLYKQTVTTLETFSKNRTNIYSASKLHGAGFKFHLLQKEEGIWKIDSKGKDIYLPCVTLHTDSEVILRNLVVYEMLMVNSDNFPLTEYVGLMCGLIMNVNDVKVLKRQKIIGGDLREDEVARLFTGMSSSIPAMKTNKKSELQERIVEVNTAYESEWRVSYLLLRKLAYWFLVVLKAIGMFAGASLKIVAFLISLMTVFLLTSQAYCDAYGCAKANVSLLTYTPFSHNT
ncbi:hypothetical protein L2E82_29668 [Cichorium intybus]|uniref:Uncharacterized protein n=1 Tax=Cichorium intybus TaxID=13427 RepID=A0ACB9CY50_CICIN|nr:hypothetical protein L2E82_29668 [Cichorium intybus]